MDAVKDILRGGTDKKLKKKKAKDERLELEQELEQEVEKVNRFRSGIVDIHKTILCSAVKQRQNEFKFNQELDRYPVNLDGVRALVQAIVRELTFQFDKANYWAQNVYELEQENSSLVSQMQGWDSEAIQRYRTRRAGVREDAKNKIKDLEDRIDKFYDMATAFEEEKRGLIEEQDLLRKQHGEEMQSFANDCEERVRKTKRAHELEKKTLESQLRDRLLDQHASEKKELEDSHNAEKRGMKAKHETEACELRAVASDLRVELSNVESRHEGNMARLKDEHKGKKQELKNKLADQQFEYKSKIDMMEQEHGSIIQQMQQEHGSRIQQMEQEHGSTIQQMEQAQKTELRRRDKDHESEKRDLIQEHESDMKRVEENYEFDRVQWSQTETKMQRDHTSQLKTLRKEHVDALDSLTIEHKTECRKLNDQIARMKKDHAAEVANLRSEFEAEKARLAQQTADTDARLKKEFREKAANLEKKHADEKEQLRKDRDAYSAALLARDKARDKFEEMKDVEIKAKFLELAQDVEKLARLEWRNDQAQVLRRLSPNTRLLMRQVLQDSIWAILHEHIFCSPFRVFGEEGHTLETQWNEQCGKDPALDNGRYTWPTPEVETERWRYITVKECRAALRKPVPSEWDPRAKLKKGFLTSIEQLRGKLAATLGEVADVDKSSTQTIKEVTMKATNMWLEFGMQRFRVVVAVQDSKIESVEERIVRAQEAELDLVLAPALKSFGNSKGQDLQAEETIGGCAGEIIKVGLRRG
ncbi:hypothetical protein EG329_007266 [Mollisiaceae sp. DMI_Dod_QoI]|nr:hypothetical protein EG329_007266 [Helotiales sp. DMI_Dod_QoI]